ncbi:PEP-CTERM sorting domain-containing protein [Fontivita pretiosa]|uniref:PEP-CTERM sorting domain-containing protein n=1 Tax=Fontivita pretiosa TaxID=2989684 RepID=UPI003D1662ED
MKVRKVVAAAATAAGFALAGAAPALAGLDPANHSIWRENAGSSFGAPPANAVEFSPTTGFGSVYDLSGRVVALAEVTENTLDSTPLGSIVPRVWNLTDADLFRIKITDPSNFSASITSTTLILALFAEDGTALAASTGGGTANAITGAAAGLSTPGIYHIGIALAGMFPKNNAGQDLFDLSTTGVKLPNALADQKLGTDPFTAWTQPGAGATTLIGNTSFTAPGSTITLSGADFAVPEPASIAAVMLGGLVLVQRRRHGGQ